jgi:hypothetical protein
MHSGLSEVEVERNKTATATAWPQEEEMVHVIVNSKTQKITAPSVGVVGAGYHVDCRYFGYDSYLLFFANRYLRSPPPHPQRGFPQKRTSTT